MPDILIPDVPQDVLEALERQAKAHNRSLEDELRAMMEEYAAIRTYRIPDEAARIKAYNEAKAISERIAVRGRPVRDSVEDLRESRDER